MLDKLEAEIVARARVCSGASITRTEVSSERRASMVASAPLRYSFLVELPHIHPPQSTVPHQIQEALMLPTSPPEAIPAAPLPSCSLQFLEAYRVTHSLLETNMAYGTADPPLEGTIRKWEVRVPFLMGPSKTNQPP
jgi:hypothetical protein